MVSTIAILNQSKLGIDDLQSLPINSGSSGFVAEDFVHLLEREVFGFRNEPPYETGSDGADEAEENECTVFGGFDHVWGRLSDCEIIQPVGRSSDGDTLGSDTERENFGYENPCART